MRQLIIFILTFSLLIGSGRENPFAPSSDTASGEITTKTTNHVYLQQESMDVPDSARKIHRVLVEYVHSDGSISKVPFEIVMDALYIDPDKPLVISQHESIDELSTLPPESKSEEIKVERIKHKINSLVSYEIFDSYIMIYSKDKLIRDFALPKPYKIVLDFKSNQFKYTTTRSHQGRFKKVAFGSHRDFYRVTVELDRMYKYRIEKQKSALKVMIE